MKFIKHTKGVHSWLAITELQINTTMRDYYIPTEMAKIKWQMPMRKQKNWTAYNIGRNVK